MQLTGNSHKVRQRRTTFRFLVSLIGLIAIFILLYLISSLVV